MYSRYISASIEEGVDVSSEGLYEYCKKVDKLYEEDSIMKDLHDRFKETYFAEGAEYIPCHTEIFRTILWYHWGFYVMERNEAPSVMVYWEDLTDPVMLDNSIDKVLKLLEIPRAHSGTKYPFVNADLRGVEFEEEDIARIRQWMSQAIPKDDPRSRIYLKRYYEGFEPYSSPPEEQEATPPQEETPKVATIDKFTKMDNSKHCSTGYYRGWGNDPNRHTMTAERCAEICDSEPDCLFFSVMVGQTCSRYNSGANGCKARRGEKHQTYSKAPVELTPPQEETPIVATIDKFTKMDDSKHCSTGYYRGWGNDPNRHTMTAERCAEICDSEPECLFFSVMVRQTCSRYNSGANGCKVRHGKQHQTYAKNTP